ncbi:putative virulence factor [Pantoea tagorei]
MRTVKPRQPQTLAKRLGLLQEALNASLGWIAEHRDASPRLALEAETFTRQLRRARVQSDALAQQVARPVTLALFGQSQAGKAWLLSEMVADAQGQLLTRLGEKKPERLPADQSRQSRLRCGDPLLPSARPPFR